MRTSPNIKNTISKAMSIYRESRHYMINRRMHFVYLKSKEYPTFMISDILNVSRKTIWDWNNILNDGGIDALTILHYKGQPSQLNQFGEQLKLEFMTNPVATLKEAQHQIEKQINIKRSLSQIRAFFQRLKLKRRKVGQIPAKVDIKKQELFKKQKLERLIKLANGQRIKLFFIDAAHFVHLPFQGYLYGIKRIFIRAAAGRKRFNVLGALDAVSKSVTTICNESYINAETVCQLLKSLASQYVGERIVLILDNARYQKCQLVTDMAIQLNIKLVYLPAYSPNFNLIERLWRFTKKKVLYNKFYSSFDDFKNAINDCLDRIKKHDYKTELNSLLTLKFQTFDMLQTNP
ncbi:MAG: IS630 family transposase [Ignavibacteriales bacterium]|nr:IS630 family transposase [Ignavibacteriales bacterium]